MEWMASEEKDGSVNSSVAQAIDNSASLEIDQPTGTQKVLCHQERK